MLARCRTERLSPVIRAGAAKSAIAPKEKTYAVCPDDLPHIRRVRYAQERLQPSSSRCLARLSQGARCGGSLRGRQCAGAARNRNDGARQGRKAPGAGWTLRRHKGATRRIHHPRSSFRRRRSRMGRAMPRSIHRRGGSPPARAGRDRKSTRLNSSHLVISYAVFCLKKKKKIYLTLNSKKKKNKHNI